MFCFVTFVHLFTSQPYNNKIIFYQLLLIIYYYILYSYTSYTFQRLSYNNYISSFLLILLIILFSSRESSVQIFFPYRTISRRGSLVGMISREIQNIIIITVRGNRCLIFIQEYYNILLYLKNKIKKYRKDSHNKGANYHNI